MRLKVLIVEDDPIQADALAHLLGSRGYYVDLAGNGRDALCKISTGMFHVALIDYRLPEIDGLGIARVVRNLPGSFTRPRLVAVTSALQDLIADEPEFDEVIGKPIVPDLLISAVERGRPADMTSAQPASASGLQHGMHRVRADGLPALPDASAERRGRVLLADDDPDLREFLRLTLESRGFDVDVAEDGLEAVRLIGIGAYDLVVVDFRMPKLDGLAAAKIIYDQTERGTRPRIVTLTSTPDSLISQDDRWHLVIDKVVSKASGLQSILMAVEDCIVYKSIRLEEPLEHLDPWSFTFVMRGVG